MARIDLNELPEDFASCDGVPLLCMQVQPNKVPISIEGVGASPELGTSPKQDVVGVRLCAAAAATAVVADATGTKSTTPAPTMFSPGATLRSNGEQGCVSGATLFGLDENEVRSSPHEPYIGMEFDTLEGAKAHYNAYSLKMGFSMKANTSRSSDSDDPVDGQDDGSKRAGCSSCKTPSGLVKKRRREFIKQTNYAAKMTVNLIGRKWVVIGVVPDHNHKLIDKPSLTKYLRCHKGIPPEEVEFLKILHRCNMETGGMMVVMSEFYGQASIVPYTTKSISNMRTSLCTAEANDGDLAETNSYFEQRQEEEPGFFFKVKKDGIGRVENLFWVDGRAREAYLKAYHDYISLDTTYFGKHVQHVVCSIYRDE
ncbi:protein FAR1-RELATED SEQUENCE 5-like [Hordeum vulgare]|nr:protein FAR1-RELATED SEQUENCE 5-like [Hordeum vulgare]